MTRKDKVLLWIYFLLFALLILLGVGAKRLWGHREWVIPLHLTAAFFLAFWGHRFFRLRSVEYKKEIEFIRKERASGEDSNGFRF